MPTRSYLYFRDFNFTTQSTRARNYRVAVDLKKANKKVTSAFLVVIAKEIKSESFLWLPPT